MPGIRARWMRLRQSQILKYTALLFSGNLVALLIPFIAAPFILRLYSPADVAEFELFVRLLEVVVVIATLRYELAVVLPASERTARRIVQLCLALSGLTAVLAFALASGWQVFAAEPLFSFPTGLVLAVGVLILAAFFTVNQWLTRTEKFKTLAASRFYAAASNSGTKYLMGLLGPQPLGLILGHLMGYLVPLLVMVVKHRLLGLFRFPRRFLSSAKATAACYRDFPGANLPHALSDEAQKALLFFLIAFIYGDILLGLFAVTFRYVRVPVQVFGHSLGQVLVQRFSNDLNHNRPVRPLLLKSLGLLFAIGIVPFGILMVFGDWIFTKYLGETWAMSGHFAQFIAPWLFFTFMVSPVSFIPTLYRRQQFYFYLTLSGNALTLLAVLLCGWLKTPFETVLIILTGYYVLYNFLLILWFYRLTGKPRAVGTE